MSERTGCFDVSADSICVFSILCSLKLFIHLLYFPVEPSSSRTGQYKTHSSLHFILTTSTTWLVLSCYKNKLIHYYVAAIKRQIKITDDLFFAYLASRDLLCPHEKYFLWGHKKFLLVGQL